MFKVKFLDQEKCMRPAKILVVDDEPHLVKLVRSNLEAQHFKVASAMDGVSGLAMVEKEGPDLVILDIMLPGMDGFDVLQKIREFSSVPVIMLTAKDQDVDVVKGLQLGADDYVKKPFSVHELLARVEAVLRRAAPGDDVQARPPFVVGDFTMDFQQRKITVRGREVKVGPTEYKLLSQLVRNAGRVMLHADLLRKVWGPEYGGETEYLRVYISYLRNKIEEDPANPKYILTEHGVGYMFKRPE
jgi:two-component system KDP operon response regulator KdpE